MNIRKYTIFLSIWGCLFSIFTFTSVLHSFASSVSVNEKKNTSDLIRLTVLEFTNKTQGAEYDYLTYLFADTISQEMKRNFVYEEVLKGQINKRLKKNKDIGSKEKKSKSKKLNIIESDIRAVAQQEKLDIIVYGEYSWITQANKDAPKKKARKKFKITTKIFFNARNQFLVFDRLASGVGANTVARTARQIGKATIKKIKEILGIQDNPILLLDTSSTLDQNVKVKEEIKWIRDYLNKKGEKIFLFNDYIKYNPKIKKPPIFTKRKSLSRWMAKNKLDKLISIKTLSNQVHVSLILDGKIKKTMTYHINAPIKTKKAQTQILIKYLKKIKNTEQFSLSPNNLTDHFDKKDFFSLGIRSGYSFLLGKLSSQVRHYYTTDLLFDIHLSNILNRNEQSIPHIQAAISFEGFQTNTDKAFYDFSLKVGPHWLFPLLGKNQYWGVGLLSVFTYETTIEKTLSQQVDLYTFGFDAFITYEYRISNYRFYLHPRLSYRYDVDLPLYAIGMLGGVSYHL